MSEIRKTKINKGGKPYLGLLPGASGPASWPAQPAGGPAHLPPLSSSSSTEGGECARRARATAPRHLPPCLPGALLVALDAPDDATQPPRPPRTLPRPPSLPLLSLSLTRSTAAAAAHHRRAPHRPLAPP